MGITHYIHAHWGGTPSFRTVFFVNTLGVRAGLWGVQAVVLPMQISSFAALTLIGTDMILYIWQAVGLMRHSARCSKSYGSTGHVSGAQLFLGVAFLASLATWWQLVLLSPLAPAPPAVLRDIVGPPPLTLTITPDGGTLHLIGEIPIAARAQVAPILSEHPEITQLELSSPGGNIRAARGLANLVLAFQLDTHVAKACSSACTLVFMAGAQRSLAPAARLGFHGYDLLVPSGHPSIDIEKEMQTDAAYFLGRGLLPGFVDQVFDVSPDSMWFPTRHDLIAAGVISE